MSDNIEAVYERVKALCVSPTIHPRITIGNIQSLLRQNGKSITTPHMPTNLIEVGFVPEPVGTQEDHRQVALVLHRTKTRKTQDGAQPLHMFDSNMLVKALDVDN